jgi:hypothetical protein
LSFVLSFGFCVFFFPLLENRSTRKHYWIQRPRIHTYWLPQEPRTWYQVQIHPPNLPFWNLTIVQLAGRIILPPVFFQP